MTGYTVHTGSTEKFKNGWDQIFKSTTETTGKKKSPAKKKKSKRKIKK